jgi:heme exporter protein C
MRRSWWKIACVVLLVYTVVGGLLLPVPALRQLQETIRNLYFHVCMWMAMMTVFTVSVVNSIKYLRQLDLRRDIQASEYATTGVVLGLLGYATGIIWASYTYLFRLFRAP